MLEVQKRNGDIVPFDKEKIIDAVNRAMIEVDKILYETDTSEDIATEIEESHPRGRLFDMDVIGTDGMKLSRGTYRKCIICGCQAQECARSRKHSVEELQAKIEELLNQFST